MFDKNKENDKVDTTVDDTNTAVTNAPTSTSGAWGSHNIVINTAEDGIQTVDVDFANGHHVHATSDDGGQAWSFEDRVGLGVDQMAVILDEAEASTETPKSSPWDKEVGTSPKAAAKTSKDDTKKK
jgi:hypothetical protein